MLLSQGDTHKLSGVHRLFQEAGSGNQQDTHKHSTYVLKHIWKEKKKKGGGGGKKGQFYSGKTTETELFSAVQLRHKSQASMLADFCCIAEGSLFFCLFMSQKLT